MFTRKMRDTNGEEMQNSNKEEKKRLFRLKGGVLGSRIQYWHHTYTEKLLR